MRTPDDTPLDRAVDRFLKSISLDEILKIISFFSRLALMVLLFLVVSTFWSIRKGNLAICQQTKDVGTNNKISGIYDVGTNSKVSKISGIYLDDKWKFIRELEER